MFSLFLRKMRIKAGIEVVPPVNSSENRNMSLGRTLIIVSVIVLAIVLILVFVAPNAWNQSVGSSDSGSSQDSSGTGGSLLGSSQETSLPFTSVTKHQQLQQRRLTPKELEKQKLNRTLANEKALALKAEFYQKRLKYIIIL